MIFWIGFIIMVLNEGFVIMRHQSPIFSKWRDKLIERYGDNWKKFHSTLDYGWVGAVSIGLIFTTWNQRWIDITAFITWWSCVLLFVYVPKWLTNENELTN
tara:strand:- start:843 stop:1145 length:303 start_codon:yes stop_codon:yes gene_type:complete